MVAVAAVSEDVAHQAALAVRIEYQALPTIATIEEAIATPTPQLHAHADSGNLHKLLSMEFGDVDAMNSFLLQWDGGEAIPFVSDFFDFSIYLDADSDVIRDWYLARFMRLRATAFRDPAAYFHRYAALTIEEAQARALHLWRSINLKNLDENILPTRQRAHLILHKSEVHQIDEVALRKL